LGVELRGPKNTQRLYVISRLPNKPLAAKLKVAECNLRGQEAQGFIGFPGHAKGLGGLAGIFAMC
jgi:hypothetical protein